MREGREREEGGEGGEIGGSLHTSSKVNRSG